MKTKEQIIAEIKKDKDFADCTADEIEEMAEMELKVQGNRRYEQSDTPRKKADRPKKVDEVKKSLVSQLAEFLTDKVQDLTITNDQKSLDFKAGGECYTLNLVKHRPKK